MEQIVKNEELFKSELEELFFEHILITNGGNENDPIELVDIPFGPNMSIRGVAKIANETGVIKLGLVYTNKPLMERPEGTLFSVVYKHTAPSGKISCGLVNFVRTLFSKEGVIKLITETDF